MRKKKYVDVIVLHYDVPNDNAWTPIKGCLDEDIKTLEEENMHVPAMYNHNGAMVMIGRCKEFSTQNNALMARIYLDDIPPVNEIVIPQLKSKTIQGASPTISAIEARRNKDTKNIDVHIGKLAEISLVGRPADLKAKILNLNASLSEQQSQQENDFDFELLTL